jgi:phytoene dehydrogenase-like protein
MRPTPSLAGYRTPIGGLYLCGPATHPGAGIAGAAGANAARACLQGDSSARSSALGRPT